MGKLDVSVGDEFPVDEPAPPSAEEAKAAEMAREAVKHWGFRHHHDHPHGDDASNESDADWRARKAEWKQRRAEWRAHRHAFRDEWRAQRDSFKAELRAKRDAFKADIENAVRERFGATAAQRVFARKRQRRIMRLLAIIGLVSLAAYFGARRGQS